MTFSMVFATRLHNKTEVHVEIKKTVQFANFPVRSSFITNIALQLLPSIYLTEPNSHTV